MLQAVFDRFVDDGTVDFQGGTRARPLMVHGTPMSATVNLNDYYSADEWSVEFDAKLLPFNPEIIRNLACQIHMYAAKSLDEPFAAQFNTDTVQILGIADRMKLRLDDEARSFEAAGTDYTALLAEAPWYQVLSNEGKGRNVRLTGGKTKAGKPRKHRGHHLRQLRPDGKRLDKLVADLVAEVLNVRGVLEVKWESDETPPIVETIPKAVREGRSYWDVIYQTVIEMGFICYVRGQDLVITTAGAQRAASERTEGDVAQGIRRRAMEAGIVPVSRQVRPVAGATRIMAWGRNLLHLEIERQVGKAQVPQQVVRSYDKKSGTVLEGRYPDVKEVAVTGVGTDKSTQQVSVVPGITSVAVLRRYAREKYDATARGEVIVRFATHDATDLAGQSLINGMRPGCGIRLGLDSLWDDGSAMRSMTAGQRYERLRRLEYSDRIARTVADSYELLRQVDKPLYLTQATMAFGDGAIAVDDCEAMNFVSPAREDANAAA